MGGGREGKECVGEVVCVGFVEECVGERVRVGGGGNGRGDVREECVDEGMWGGKCGWGSMRIGKEVWVGERSVGGG